MKVPISLIVDDGAPINLAYWLHPEQTNEYLVPNEFTRDFARFCRRHGVRGKFSVPPWPSGAGRIDGSITRVPASHLRGFLDICRRYIKPQFDITPELLTHQQAVELETGRLLHLFEDEWVARASAEQIADYVACALRILRRVGLAANGVSSPWGTGNRNEATYAKAVGLAQWRVHRRRVSWYFLKVNASGPPLWPKVTYRDPRGRFRVVSVPANAGDAFWASQNYRDPAASAQAIAANVDALLSPDGSTGRIRDLYEAHAPIVFLTHWQSLFSNNLRVGLDAFKQLIGRIERTFGNKVVWVKCSQLARAAARAS